MDTDRLGVVRSFWIDEGWAQQHFTRRKRKLSPLSSWCLHTPKGIRNSMASQAMANTDRLNLVLMEAGLNIILQGVSVCFHISQNGACIHPREFGSLAGVAGDGEKW